METEQIEAPSGEESAPTTELPSSPSWEEAQAAAIDTLAQRDAEVEASEESKAAPKSETPKTAKEEADYIKWVNSQTGLLDPKTQRIRVGPLAKQAYELNRQNQELAQKFNQLQPLLSNPAVSKAIELALTGQVTQQPQPQAEAKPKEQTDEEILQNFVNGEIQKAIAPLQQSAQVLYQKHVFSEIVNAENQLRDQLGKDEDGNFVLDSVIPDITAMVNRTAQQVGCTPFQLSSFLLERGLLFQTLQDAANKALFPKLSERLNSLTVKKEAEKKRTQLTPRGTPPQSVTHKEPRAGAAMSFEEAAEAAEKEAARR